jgi:hypothetical protein
LTKCELCGKNYKDILQHLSIMHDIHDLDDYNQEVAKVQNAKSDRNNFSSYVGEMQARRSKGEISAEEYRELIAKWKK